MSNSGRVKLHQSISVWVVIPSFNVASLIQGVVDSIPIEIRGIVVVNDASTDTTANTLVLLAKQKRLHILNNDKNLLKAHKLINWLTSLNL